MTSGRWRGLTRSSAVGCGSCTEHPAMHGYADVSQIVCYGRASVCAPPPYTCTRTAAGHRSGGRSRRVALMHQRLIDSSRLLLMLSSLSSSYVLCGTRAPCARRWWSVQSVGRLLMRVVDILYAVLRRADERFAIACLQRWIRGGRGARRPAVNLPSCPRPPQFKRF